MVSWEQLSWDLLELWWSSTRSIVSPCVRPVSLLAIHGRKSRRNIGLKRQGNGLNTQRDRKHSGASNNTLGEIPPPTSALLLGYWELKDARGFSGVPGLLEESLPPSADGRLCFGDLPPVEYLYPESPLMCRCWPSRLRINFSWFSCDLLARHTATSHPAKRGATCVVSPPSSVLPLFPLSLS